MNKAVQEKMDTIDNAISSVIAARDTIKPLTFNDKNIAAAAESLLEARDALNNWRDVLSNEDKRATGNEKKYIMRRLEKSRAILDGLIDDYDGGSPEESAGIITDAIKILD